MLLAPNAGTGVGGGHVMRCLSLATALSWAGARCVFALSPAGEAIAERFAGPRPEQRQAADFGAVVQAAAELRPLAVVLDHYGWGAAEEERLRPFATRLMALDDLADRPHDVDLLLDSSHGRGADAYAGKLPAAARLLLGPDYALLRPAFAERRAAAFAPVRPRVERVFVSFGLSDVEEIAGRGVGLLRRAAPLAHLDVALASDAGSLPGLRRRAERDPALRVHVDATDIAQLIAPCDLAVGGGGSATWERCCLGAPTLSVVVADNQRVLIGNLDHEGALLSCDLQAPAFDAAFLEAFARLQDPALRARLRETSRGLCDGAGAARAADALLSSAQGQR